MGPLPDSWLAARMADLTPDLQVRLSWGLIAESFHSLQSLSVSCFHVILGLPGPRFPSACMTKVVLTTPLKHSTCPYHQTLLSIRVWKGVGVLGSWQHTPTLFDSKCSTFYRLRCGAQISDKSIFCFAEFSYRKCRMSWQAFSISFSR